MIKFIFEDKEVRVPSQWDEVTVAHFVNPHFLAGDSLGLLSALSDIPRDTLLNTTEDITKHLYKMVRFVQEEPQGYRKHIPETLRLMGKDCKVPMDIEVQRVGQKIMLQDAVFKNENVYESIPDAIAIYLQPETNDGKFDDSQLPKVREEVLKLKIVDVFPIADFFLLNSKSIMKSGGTF